MKPYTGKSLRRVLLCEETGYKATTSGVCILHDGDACLYEYKHPYDNSSDLWKRVGQW